jgi:hypothetical protein
MYYIYMCLYVYKCIYIYIYKYIYSHTYIHTHTHIHICQYSGTSQLSSRAGGQKGSVKTLKKHKIRITDDQIFKRSEELRNISDFFLSDLYGDVLKCEGIIYTYIYTYMHLCVYFYLYICVYLFVHKYI